MRRPLVAGNWKMNLSRAEAEAYAARFVPAVAEAGADVAICPPFPLLGMLGKAFEGTNVALGAQDVFWMPKGAFTGSVSAPMLADAGVTYGIVGHSETRGRFGKLEVEAEDVGYFAETDATVRRKIAALVAAGIAPVLCVGETRDEREAGRTDDVIRAQIEAGLPDDPGDLVVAYEPVWAIGTGLTCDTAEAQRVCAFVRSVLGDLGERTRILYGGSVKASNAAELFAQPDVDGGLVGGASLDPDEFARVVLAAK